MNKTSALERLNQDKNYEDKLVADLNQYFLDCLDSISNITPQEKDALKMKLNTIIEDSKRHSFLFDDLINVVLEDGTDKF